jgi:hypothetical protein
MSYIHSTEDISYVGLQVDVARGDKHKGGQVTDRVPVRPASI